MWTRTDTQSSTPPRRGSVGRRTLTLALVAGAVALPAGIMRALCVGESCSSDAAVETRTPFCSLPDEMRAQITAGYREGRSPNLLAIASEPGVAGAGGVRPAPSWPSLDRSGASVPLLFQGAGVAPGANIPAAVTLDRVAPTVADIIGLRRPHPEVRSGTAVEGIADGERPALVLEIVLKGVESNDVRGGGWPKLDALFEAGAGTLDAHHASEPRDPAAAIATIGTGGLPRQHGITGSSLRSDDGKLVRAWGPGAPVSVIATLADDLDELRNQRPLIGLVGTSPTDRGAIGGNWYVRNDHDDFVLSVRAEADELLRKGYGRDSTTDLLVAVLSGDPRRMDARIGALVRSARVAAGGALLTVVTATGNLEPPPEAVPASFVRQRLESVLGADVVEGFGAGGVFVDQAVLAREQITEDDVVQTLRDMRRPNGARLFVDVFPGIAISFARYC